MKTFVFSLLLVGISCQNLDSGNLKVLYRVFDKCSDDSDMASCLKLKAVTLMDKALAMDALPISDYVIIKKDPKSVVEPVEVKTEGEVEASLPRNLDEKSSALDGMLQDRVAKYLDTRTIQLTVPADILEGRKKKDKGGMMLMAAVAMGGMMMQLAMGKIALLAGKALLVGKIALLLSAIIGLKKLVSGGGGESHPQVVYASSGGDHHGGGWGRSAETAQEAAREAAQAQDLAYRAHKTLE